MATRNILISFQNWLRCLNCHGNTCLLDALEVSVVGGATRVWWEGTLICGGKNR